jgi:hypothetical protein
LISGQAILNSGRIVALVGQRISAAVARHVSMSLEGEAGACANPLDDPVDGIRL